MRRHAYLAMAAVLFSTAAMADPEPRSDKDSPELRDALISILQQQRNEAMDRGTVVAAQLTLAQKRIAELEKAAKAAAPQGGEASSPAPEAAPH